MKCLSCAAEIPGSFLADLSKSKGSRIALFNCPQCHAAHIQRAGMLAPRAHRGINDGATGGESFRKAAALNRYGNGTTAVPQRPERRGKTVRVGRAGRRAHGPASGRRSPGDYHAADAVAGLIDQTHPQGIGKWRAW